MKFLTFAVLIIVALSIWAIKEFFYQIKDK
jgi:hypothetical protein